MVQSTVESMYIIYTLQNILYFVYPVCAAAYVRCVSSPSYSISFEKGWPWCALIFNVSFLGLILFSLFRFLSLFTWPMHAIINSLRFADLSSRVQLHTHDTMYQFNISSFLYLHFYYFSRKFMSIAWTIGRTSTWMYVHVPDVVVVVTGFVGVISMIVVGLGYVVISNDNWMQNRIMSKTFYGCCVFFLLLLFRNFIFNLYLCFLASPLCMYPWHRPYAHIEIGTIEQVNWNEH